MPSPIPLNKCCAAFAVLALSTAPATAQAPFSVEIELPAATVAEISELGLETPITGRVYFIVTRDSASEPRNQTDVTGVPFWGMDVRDLSAGEAVTIAANDPSVTGYPIGSLRDLPAGDYYVQAFLNVYTTFHRSDGSVVEMHQETGEGQNLWRSPGNAHSAVRRMHLDPSQGGTLALSLSEVIPPIEPLGPGDVLQQGNPVDTEHVKFVKIRSDLLSEFWGRDMYIGANVLLPRGYEQNPEMEYPVIYLQGHFPGRRAPLGFREGSDDGFTQFWLSDDAPRMIAISIRDANPYYDTSYSVNSANLGPYGDAITDELIPFLEGRFNIISDPSARVLAGGSTGGWEALAMQIQHPSMFAGAWGWCPDAVDFQYHQIVDIYDDPNAYYVEYPWMRVERPSNRRPDGNIVFTMRDENLFELAVGPDTRSGGQWAVWEAVYGPIGDDGYPARIWDPVTGVIDHQVAEYWRENYDLRYILERDWETLGPQLRGKLHVAVGDMDSYYLNNAVHLLEDFLESTTDPVANAEFQYGRGEPHCWIGHSPNRAGEEMNNAEFVRVVAEYFAGR
ncbi:MAG TPA: alpha/beta hydrolase-fold protein [Longimicrobiaceae bacterium]|nr:alpha/beta hydrolase-fold protein [Longimicrobiaceae bacterium]